MARFFSGNFRWPWGDC